MKRRAALGWTEIRRHGDEDCRPRFSKTGRKHEVHFLQHGAARAASCGRGESVMRGLQGGAEGAHLWILGMSLAWVSARHQCKRHRPQSAWLGPADI